MTTLFYTENVQRLSGYLVLDKTAAEITQSILVCLLPAGYQMIKMLL